MSPSVHRMIVMVLLATLLPSLWACGVFRLGRDLEVLYDEIVIISGDLKVDDGLTGQPIALLVRPTAEGLGDPAGSNLAGSDLVGSDGESRVLGSPGYELVDYRFADAKNRYNFQARPGNYRLMAFLDQNGDFLYQPHEPGAVLDEVPKENRLDTRRRRWKFNQVVIDSRALDTRLPLVVDLTTAGLSQLERTVTTMGVPVNFRSGRFKSKAIAQGMWEPSRWFVDVNYGFYLLEPWGPQEDKPLLLLVHGINGSPKDFQRMLKGLDTSGMRVALFHYPSGISIEDNAFMLSQIMNELFVRTPNQEYSLIAHSLGGLISKRALQLQEEAGHGHRIKKFISISVPWAGHKGAAAGAEYSPVVAPVWTDLAPKSRFISRLADYSLPEEVDYTLFFSHGGSSRLSADSNDGAVSLDSQLDPGMQDRADQLIGVSQDHVGILRDRRTLGALSTLLQSP